MTLGLQEVNGIGKSLAEKLKVKGIDSIEKLASMELQNLSKISGIGKATGLRYIESANKLLVKKKEGQKKEISSKSKAIKEQKFIKTTHKEFKDKEKKEIYKRKAPYKKPISSKSKPIREQRPITKTFKRKKIQQKSGKLTIKTFFPKEVMQRIRFLHFKIKKLEKTLKRDEDFNLDELNYVLDYVKILNINYKTQSQIKIFKELDINSSFYDPLEDREIKIWDLMFECTRVLWVLARAYAHLSEKFETEKQMKNAIIAMVECSKIYKTTAYFSAACTRQEDKGLSLSAENLELNSEEARIFAQNLAAIREENNNNFSLASQMYAGLSALSKRLYFLKNHNTTKEQHLKAQFNYDMGKACYLKAKALLKSSIALENEEKIKKLSQKSNYYFSKTEEIWENLVKNSDSLSKVELDNLRRNLSVVNDNIIENDVEVLDYNNIKDIQNPAPFIAVPENLGLFLPRSTMYLTKYPSRNLNFDRFKEYRISKLELGSHQSKIEKLLNEKAGIGRTIKQLKFLYERNDIDINIFFELLEKYEIKLEIIESKLERLKKGNETSKVDKS